MSVITNDKILDGWMSLIPTHSSFIRAPAYKIKPGGWPQWGVDNAPHKRSSGRMLAKKTRLKSAMYMYIDKCSVFVLKDEFTRAKGWAVCEHDIESPLKDFVG